MSWLNNKIILLGPYVGSFEYEILWFKPFVNWFVSNFTFKDIFISTHYDRFFLYNEKIIPIMRQYTRDISLQNNHLHKKINATDYNVLKKIIIDNITEISGYDKKEIISYDLGYSSMPNKSSLQRRFIPLKIISESNPKVLFIPHLSTKRKDLKRTHSFLKNKCYFETIGGNDTDFNITHNTYEEIIKKISKCKCVVTPCSFWTVICNLQNVPVFSWGKNISIYRGIYNFGNENSKIVYSEKKKDKFFWNLLEEFIKKYNKEN